MDNLRVKEGHGIVLFTGRSVSRAVNRIAMELVSDLQDIVEVAADYEATAGTETTIYNLGSGKPLYCVKRAMEEGCSVVRIESLSNEAQRYLNLLNS